MMDDEYAMPDDPTATDAEWKKIQQNTFTRWCNEHLRNVNLYIYNLETDLCDGLKLLALLQVLSHKKIRRFNKKPSFRPQKIENIAIALKFIEDEKIKLVNIDASDILKGNLKLILGLIWTLILKYQISLPMMDDDDEEASNITPKQALMGWVKSKLPPEMPVRNFTTAWNDGIAIASLVESTAPGLFPDWEDLRPENALSNATEAMQRAEDWLGVPQVITPAEITNPNVDELSVMTYVSYFPEAKLKNGAPLKPKLTSASKCSAFGPGLEEHGVIVKKPADFTVQTSGSSKGKLNVQVFGPGRKQIECGVQDNQDNTYSCQYEPPKEGVYDVHVRIGGHHIPNSPFRVNVASGLDATKVVAQGPGLEPSGVIVGRPAPFEVIATDAGEGELVIDCIDPKGNKKTDLKMEDAGNGVWKCQYIPAMVGRYVIVIKFGGKEVAKSPYHVNVTPAADCVKIYGPGLEQGLKTGKPTTFTIDATTAGEGAIECTIEGPSRNNIDFEMVNNGDGTHTVTYRPTKPGQYTISVKFDKVMVPKCPVKVAVGTCANASTKIKAWGPGLERGVAGRPVVFYVNVKNAPMDNLSVAVDGAAPAKVEMVAKDDEEGTMVVTYYPTTPGKYLVHIRYEETDIKESPYTAVITPRGDLSKVYAKGPGLEEGNMAGKPCEFTVFTKDAGVKNPAVTVVCVNQDTNEPVDVRVKNNGDGTFKCTYFPKVPGTHNITIEFMDEPIPKSPVKVTIKAFCDPGNVKCYGPGLSGGKCGKPAQFSIDATKAGEGGIDVTIEGPKETEIKYDDHGDGTCGVEYLPVDEGEYKINVLFDQQHVPGSPFTALICDEFDAGKVVIDGPGLQPGKTGSPCIINIDSTKAGKAKLGADVLDEEGSPVRVEMKETKPGVTVMTYYPEKDGTHTINVTFGGKHVPKSPAKVKITFETSSIKVFGPGVEPEGVCCDEPTYFEVDASEACEGKPQVTIEPATDKKLPTIKPEDVEIKPGDKPNTFIVTYTGPVREGDYLVTVKFGGQPVPKSPFKIKVKVKVDATKCKAYGPGLEEPIIGRENVFTVDVPVEAGKAPLTCTVESPSGKKTPVKITDNGKGGFDVAYKPEDMGPYKINVKYGDDDIPGSTFQVDVLGPPDASKVKAYGPGLEFAEALSPAKFTIETKEAGPGDLGLTIQGPEEAPISCTDNGDGTCAVEYTPKTPGEYDVNILFDGQHIPNSPFKVQASEPVDVSKVKVSGPGVAKTIPASIPVEFTVDATATGKAPCTVEVVGPKDEVYPCDVTDNGDKTFTCKYTPKRKGKYEIKPKYAGKPVPGAPFKVTGEPLGDASKVKCTGPGLNRPHLGFAAPFEVDCTKAGKGLPNVSAKGPEGDSIPVQCVEEEPGVYACEYIPEQLGPHEVEVLFGGNDVPGSVFKSNATPAPEIEKVKVQELEDLLEAGPCVDQEFEGPVDCSEVPDNKEAILTGKITTPSGKKEPVDVTDNHDGTFALNYTPKDVGKYVLEVGYDGIPIPGSPFEFEVTEGGPDKVNVFGKGIRKGVVAVPARFTVDTKNAGPGDLSVAVEGPSKVDIDCVDNGDGTCEVTYVPVEPGDYDVIVKFDNQSVPGSPFKPKILQNEPAVEVGSPSDICMSPEGISPKDLPKLQGELESPSGKTKPVELKEGPEESILASFVPDEAGINQLHLKKDGKEVPGSPVPVLAREKPIIGEPSKIPLEAIDCDIPQDLAKMTGILTRPNGKDEEIKVEEGPQGTIEFVFVPEEPGKHLITVSKDCKQIEDSPFVIMVEGTSPDQYPHVGEPCDKAFHQPEPVNQNEVNKMQSTLRRPSGKEEPVDVKLGPDGTIAVSFVPTEAGEHLVSVKKDGHHVPHSPFSIMVIDEPTMPTVGSECAANFDIPELDLPKDLKLLTGTLTRPNGKEEPLELGVGPDDSLAINFIPLEAGKHMIGIKKRGRHVKDSPFEIMVGEAKPKSKGPTVGQDCAANLECPDLKLPEDLKDLKGVVETPSGEKQPIELACSPDGTLDVNFTPEMPGEHLVHVTKKGKPIKDSPFPIMVEDGEPTGPQVGRDCGVNLDIPELSLPRDLKNVTAELTRPNGKKEPLEADIGPDETLAVGFTPEQPGKHLIDVKKRGRPVKGSPFEVDVAPSGGRQPIDEEIVPSSMVDDQHSAPEFLDDFLPAEVGRPCLHSLGTPAPSDLSPLEGTVVAPSGKQTPAVLDKAPDGTLAVEFTPEEPGKHVVDVKKDGKPIPGSPFPILVDEPGNRPKMGNPVALGQDLPKGIKPADIKNLKGVVTAPSGKKSPVECTLSPDDQLGLEFTPEEMGRHVIDVTKNGKPVDGSPFVVMVGEEEPVEPRVGDLLDLDYAVSDVDLPKDLKDLEAILTRPSGKKEPITCTSTPEEHLGLEFIPEEAGEHIIDVKKKNGRPVDGSPFRVLVQEEEPEAPKVGDNVSAAYDLPDIVLPRDLKDLEAMLTRPNGKKEPVKCTSTPEETLGLEFTPEQPGKHIIDVTKKGKPVKGSPFEVMVEEEEPVPPKVGDVCNVDQALPDVVLPKDLKDLEAILTRPTGKRESIKCSATPEDTLGLEFTPTEPGKHLVDVTKKGKPVEGSPFVILVEDEEPNAPKMGGPCDLDYDVANVNLPKDLKDLKAILTRPTGKQEPINCTSTPDEHLGLEFTPESPGEHVIDVTKNGKPVEGSPFKVMVQEEEPTMPVVGDVCDLDYAVPDVILPKDLKELEAVLTRPSGVKEPINCTSTPDEHLGLEFTPQESGEHIIDVKKKGKPVTGSPFRVMVEEEVEPPKVGDKCDLGYDIPGVTSPSDLKDLKATVKRPSGKKEPIPCTMKPDKTLGLEFTPEEPGRHIIDITKKGRPVKGSPFEVIVEETLPPAKPTVGSKCEVDYDIPDVTLPRDLKDLKASVTRPSGKQEAIECTITPENTLGLEFTPEESGKHVVDVTKRGRPVKGSPFEILVEEEEPTGSKPTVGHKCDVGFDIPEITLPRDLKLLKAMLIRPDCTEEEIKCTCSPDNTLGLEFTPRQPGEHKVVVKKHGKPVKGSPFIIMVEEDTDTAPEQKPTVGNKCEVDFDIPDVNLPNDLKNLKAKLTRPSGIKEDIPCTCSPDNTLGLEFVPAEPGQHKIEVTKNGRPVKGSPFIVMVEEDQGPDSKPTVGHKCDVDFDIPDVNLPQDLKALNATLTRPNGVKEPVTCTSTPDNTLGLEFTPQQPGKHVIEVTKNKRPVKGSPFVVMVEEDQNPPSKPSVGHKCDVDFEIPDVNLPQDMNLLEAALTRPSGKTEQIPCTCTPDNTLGLEFTPQESGKHVIDVKKRGVPVKGSPFVVMVEDDGPVETKPTVGHKCDVDFDIPDVTLPRDLKDLKAKLSRPNGVTEEIPCTCSPDNTLGLEFTPQEPGKHVIEVTKRGRPVKGSPFEVMVEVDETASKVPTVGSECDVNLEIPGVNLEKDFNTLRGTLKRPGKTVEEPLTLKKNPNNTIGIVFVPEQVGRHEVGIKKNGKHVPGSPFEVVVHEVADSQGPRIGCPVDISLDITVSMADLRDMKASLTKPNGKEEPITLELNDKKQPIINFTPDSVGLHKVNITKKGKHLPGSPIEVMVSQGKKKPTCDVGFEIPGIKLPDDLKYLKGSVVSPSGTEEDVVLQLGPNNTIVVSFLPKEVGTHYIHIKKHGKHIGDSPYEVVVKPEDVAPGKPDASKVKCTGKGLRGGRPCERAEFVVDTRNAGYGGLGLSVEGPSKVEINCVDNEDGTCSVDYTPTESGTYLINVTYADAHVPGSPFKCRISPDGMPISEDEIMAVMEDGVEQAGEFSDMLAFPSSKARSPQDFVIKFSGPGDLKASVSRPSGMEDDAEVVETGHDTYTVRFVPKETGEHLVNVKSRRKHIPGSPFKVIVEAPAGGATACKAYGPGLEGGNAGEPCRFTVITRDAGPGGLAVAVEGPAKAEIQCHDNGDGSCDITWYPIESGEYTIHIRFADEAIPGSPCRVFVQPADEGTAMSMESFKEQVLRVGQQASFAVQMKGKRGKISASVTSPSNAQIDCNVAELEEGNYAVRFVPRELGDHLVSVFLDGHHIPGSPFTVKVGGLEGDPSKVMAYGPGLKGGLVGRPAEFTVNALDAGSGALALSIDGPAKVKMNCVEQDDGTYKVIYNPTVSGIYEISIRFAGQHIPGSAYKVHIAANETELDAISVSGDASKCKSSGRGLHNATAGEASTFTVDASGAGRGAIMVGVEGPVIPAREIVVRHTGGNVYSVNYVLEEPGDYVLQVLWAGRHIPGSPFHLTV